MSQAKKPQDVRWHQQSRTWAWNWKVSKKHLLRKESWEHRCCHQSTKQGGRTGFSSLSCCLFFSQTGADFEPPEFLEAGAACRSSHVGNGSHGARADAPPSPPSPPPPAPSIVAIFQAQGKRVPLWVLPGVSLCRPSRRCAATRLIAPAVPRQAGVPGLHPVPSWAQSQALHGHHQGTEGTGTHGRGGILFLLFLLFYSLLLAHVFLFSHHWKGPWCRPLQSWSATHLAALAFHSSIHSSRATQSWVDGGQLQRALLL